MMKEKTILDREIELKKNLKDKNINKTLKNRYEKELEKNFKIAKQFSKEFNISIEESKSRVYAKNTIISEKEASFDFTQIYKNDKYSKSPLTSVITEYDIDSIRNLYGKNYNKAIVFKSNRNPIIININNLRKIFSKTYANSSMSTITLLDYKKEIKRNDRVAIERINSYSDNCGNSIERTELTTKKSDNVKYVLDVSEKNTKSYQNFTIKLRMRKGYYMNLEKAIDIWDVLKSHLINNNISLPYVFLGENELQLVFAFNEVYRKNKLIMEFLNNIIRKMKRALGRSILELSNQNKDNPFNYLYVVNNENNLHSLITMPGTTIVKTGEVSHCLCDKYKEEGLLRESLSEIANGINEYLRDENYFKEYKNFSYSDNISKTNIYRTLLDRIKDLEYYIKTANPSINERYSLWFALVVDMKNTGYSKADIFNKLNELDSYCMFPYFFTNEQINNKIEEIQMYMSTHCDSNGITKISNEWILRRMEKIEVKIFNSFRVLSSRTRNANRELKRIGNIEIKTEVLDKYFNWKMSIKEITRTTESLHERGKHISRNTVRKIIRENNELYVEYMNAICSDNTPKIIVQNLQCQIIETLVSEAWKNDLDRCFYYLQIPDINIKENSIAA